MENGNGILSKIKKLQALAGSNPSEAEATAAAAKVQELLREHNLSMTDVDNHCDEQLEAYGKTEYSIPNTNRLTMTWKSILLNGLAKHNFCFAVRHSGTSRVSIIGKPSNVSVVCYLLESITPQIERLAMEASREVFSNRALYQREFCFGATSRILARLREEKAAAEAVSEKCTALMVVTGKELARAVKSHFPHLQNTTHPIGGRTSGYGDGHRAGSSVGLPRGGLGAGGRRSLQA